MKRAWSVSLWMGLGSLLFYMVQWVGSVPLAKAQQATQLRISPVTFELTANPGDTVTNEIKVTNVSDGVLQLETRTENIAGTGDQGQVKLTEEETKFSLSSWLKTQPDHFSLGPKETKTVSFTLQVPKFAEPGGHYGTVLIGTIASDQLGTSGSAVAQRIGSLVLVKVSGESKEALTVKKFEVKPFTGDWDEVPTSDGKDKFLIAKNDVTAQVTPQIYFDHGPIGFGIRLHNDGTVHNKLSGYVTVSNFLGHKIAQLPIDPRNVFPDNDRDVTVIWPVKHLLGIFYRAQLVGVYGSTNQTITMETHFWAFPIKLAIALGVVLIILLLARRRLAKVVRVLLKGD